MNQGARNGAAKVRPAQEGPIHPISRVLRDLFYPDYDRRLWLRTRSADLGDEARHQALAGCWLAPDTAGGELHPALRIA